MKLVICISLLFLSWKGICQQTYYVSATGNDSNTGTSWAAPWRTILEIEPGNTYLLRRGDVFYFNISPAKEPTEDKKTIISTYGKGEKPVINLFKRIKASSWVNERPNIWKVDLTKADNYSGFDNRDANVGFIKVDGKIYGNKKKSIDLLSSSWDFYSDSTSLYIFLKSGKPLKSGPVDVSCNITAIKLTDGMTIEDIKIMGAGGHGISGLSPVNVTIRNITVAEIGGSYLTNFKNGTTRYGNGIQLGNGSNNCVVENCTVSEVYDAAFTMQGEAPSTHFINTTFKNNVAKNNEQSFEIWVRGGGQGFTNCKFIDNQCLNAGFGWSHKYRPAKYEGVHLLSYDLDCQNVDLLVEGNTFYKAKSGLYYYLNDRNSPRYTSKNNIITLNANVPIKSSPDKLSARQQVFSSPSAFTKSTGHERGSRFKRIQATTP